MFDLLVPSAEVVSKRVPNLHSNLRPKLEMFIESPPWVPHALVRGGDSLVWSGDDGVSALVSVVVAETVLVDQRQHLAPPLVVDDPAALLGIVLISFIYFPLVIG